MAATERHGFSAAVTRFLVERAASVAHRHWTVESEDDGEWELRLWLDGDYAGRWRVTTNGSEPVEDSPSAA